MQQCHLLLALLQAWFICSLLSVPPWKAAIAAAAAASTQQTQQQAAASSAGTTTAATTAAAAPAEPPSFCKPAGLAGAAYPNAAGPTNMVWGGNMLKVYHNLYNHNKKWYAVLDTSSNGSNIDQGISLNAQLIKLPTTDSEDFQQNLKVCYVPGVTLFIDFPFPAFPDNLGHWAELLLPLYSALSSTQLQQHLQGNHQYIDRLLLLNVRQQLLYNWPREVLGLALNPALPPWPTADGSTGSTDSSSSSSSSSSGLGWHETLPWERPLPPIINPVDYDAWCASGWMVFENIVVLQDRYPIVSIPDETRPPRPTWDPAAAASDSDLWATDLLVGFNKPRLAAKFRSEALARHFWDRPVHRSTQQKATQQKQTHQQQAQQQRQLQQAGHEQCEAEGGVCEAIDSAAAAETATEPSSSSSSSIPRTVTVLWYPEDYPPVTNHRHLVQMLEELTEPYGFKVRTVSLTMGAPFLSHMATMADTGLLVGRHGPLLASAVLLPPGAAVLELLPYKWEWRGVSTLYYNMTQSTGQLHHWAWRPLDAKWCKYKEPSDARYAGWLPTECQGRDCLLVHAQAGLEVDLVAVRQLLARKLLGLVAGESVEQLKEPWPPAE